MAQIETKLRYYITPQNKGLNQMINKKSLEETINQAELTVEMLWRLL